MRGEPAEWDFVEQMLGCAKSFQSCPTLCNPVDHSPPASSVYVILQARILEWVAISLGQSPFKMQEPVLNVNVNMLYECVLLIQP